MLAETQNAIFNKFVFGCNATFRANEMHDVTCGDPWKIAFAFAFRFAFSPLLKVSIDFLRNATRDACTVNHGFSCKRLRGNCQILCA